MGMTGAQPDLRHEASALLRTAVGSATAEFRPDQWEAIEALLARQRLLVVERTGWGKSMVYFLATRLLRQRGAGCTVLISPLLSLMRNQIESARRIGVRAETINSANVTDWPPILAALQQGQVDVLLISPERLANDDFVTTCLLPIAQQIGLLVVDEAQCISDWGHDFRPDYRRIVRILRALPANIPVLATTATANDRVVEDVEQQLGPNLRTIRGPLTRESLWLQNLVLPTKTARMAWIAQQVSQMEGSGIIYTLTKRDSDNLAAWLRSRGINAPAYHSGMDKNSREQLEGQLLRNEVKALVATVALGMGFDKPDLGFVIHFQRPASVVSYYQQVGRAGRALENAYGILLCGAEDDEIADYFIRTAFPTGEEITQILAILRDARGSVTAAALQQHANLTKSKLDKALKFLQLESPTPIQKIQNSYVLNPVRWQMPAAQITRITDLRRVEQERMRAYMATNKCLMQFLSQELSDATAGRCRKCANCHGQGLSADIPRHLAEAAVEFLDSLAFIIEPRKMWPGLMQFEGLRGRIQPELQNQPGRALCRWGDPGLGDLIREGKQQTGHFPDRLVEAAVCLIRQWMPQPFPEWVTCVPSRRHVRLVPDFCRRLANALEIPFIECIQKLRETEPQKTRQNTYQQLQNLEGVFQIDHNLVRHAPVLLVDDMVDSRWTMTVLGVKLQQAGSGPVFPFALADSSQDGDD
jgi:ATP-dependent DNA helicase RecQ